MWGEFPLSPSLSFHLDLKLFVWQDAESRAEYGEMNVQRIHLQIDQLEDELIGQKQKCKAINDELQQTFNDMVEQYWPLPYSSTILLEIYLYFICKVLNRWNIQ